MQIVEVKSSDSEEEIMDDIVYFLDHGIDEPKTKETIDLIEDSCTSEPDIAVSEVPCRLNKEVAISELPVSRKEIAVTEVPCSLKQIEVAEVLRSLKQIEVAEVPRSLKQIEVAEVPCIIKQVAVTEVPCSLKEVSWYGQKSAVSLDFLNNTRNLRLVRKLKPLSVRVVDCARFSMHYSELLRSHKPGPKSRRNWQFMKLVKDTEALDSYKIVESFRDECDTMIPLQNNGGMQMESSNVLVLNEKTQVPDPETLSEEVPLIIIPDEIDVINSQPSAANFKKNIGLIGMKISSGTKDLNSATKNEHKKKYNLNRYKEDNTILQISTVTSILHDPEKQTSSESKHIKKPKQDKFKLNKPIYSKESKPEDDTIKERMLEVSHEQSKLNKSKIHVREYNQEKKTRKRGKNIQYSKWQYEVINKHQRGEFDRKKSGEHTLKKTLKEKLFLEALRGPRPVIKKRIDIRTKIKLQLQKNRANMMTNVIDNCGIKSPTSPHLSMSMKNKNLVRDKAHKGSIFKTYSHSILGQSKGKAWAPEVITDKSSNDAPNCQAIETNNNNLYESNLALSKEPSPLASTTTNEAHEIKISIIMKPTALSMPSLEMDMTDRTSLDSAESQTISDNRKRSVTIQQNIIDIQKVNKKSSPKKTDLNEKITSSNAKRVAATSEPASNNRILNKINKSDATEPGTLNKLRETVLVKISKQKLTEAALSTATKHSSRNNLKEPMTANLTEHSSSEKLNDEMTSNTGKYSSSKKLKEEIMANPKEHSSQKKRMMVSPTKLSFSTSTDHDSSEKLKEAVLSNTTTQNSSLEILAEAAFRSTSENVTEAPMDTCPEHSFSQNDTETKLGSSTGNISPLNLTKAALAHKTEHSCIQNLKEAILISTTRHSIPLKRTEAALASTEHSPAKKTKITEKIVISTKHISPPKLTEAAFAYPTEHIPSKGPKLADAEMAINTKTFPPQNVTETALPYSNIAKVTEEIDITKKHVSPPKLTEDVLVYKTEHSSSRNPRLTEAEMAINAKHISPSKLTEAVSTNLTEHSASKKPKVTDEMTITTNHIYPPKLAENILSNPPVMLKVRPMSELTKPPPRAPLDAVTYQPIPIHTTPLIQNLKGMVAIIENPTNIARQSAAKELSNAHYTSISNENVQQIDQCNHNVMNATVPAYDNVPVSYHRAPNNAPWHHDNNRTRYPVTDNSLNVNMQRPNAPYPAQMASQNESLISSYKQPSLDLSYFEQNKHLLPPSCQAASSTNCSLAQSSYYNYQAIMNSGYFNHNSLVYPPVNHTQAHQISYSLPPPNRYNQTYLNTNSCALYPTTYIQSNTVPCLVNNNQMFHNVNHQQVSNIHLKNALMGYPMNYNQATSNSSNCAVSPTVCHANTNPNAVASTLVYKQESPITTVYRNANDIPENVMMRNFNPIDIPSSNYNQNEHATNLFSEGSMPVSNNYIPTRVNTAKINRNSSQTIPVAQTCSSSSQINSNIQNPTPTSYSENPITFANSNTAKVVVQPANISPIANIPKPLLKKAKSAVSTKEDVRCIPLPDNENPYVVVEKLLVELENDNKNCNEDLIVSKTNVKHNNVAAFHKINNANNSFEQASVTAEPKTNLYSSPLFSQSRRVSVDMNRPAMTAITSPSQDRPKSTQTKCTGYSAPILPIPTIEKTLQIMSVMQEQEKKELLLLRKKQENFGHLLFSESNYKKTSSVNYKRCPDRRKSCDEKREEPKRKISFKEYKSRFGNDGKGADLTKGSPESKEKNNANEQKNGSATRKRSAADHLDLGYDSDSVIKYKNSE